MPNKDATMTINDHRNSLIPSAILIAFAGASLSGCGQGSAPAANNASTEAADAAKPAAEGVVMTAQAIKDAGIATEQIASGGLGAEIVSQALVSSSPTGEAIVTARAGGAVTRVLKRLGDPVRAGEALAMVESREAVQFTADRGVADAKARLAQRTLTKSPLPKSVARKRRRRQRKYRVMDAACC
jgi:cobalt-zinc-cadmium efflux system membrane fusion protein